MSLERCAPLVSRGEAPDPPDNPTPAFKPIEVLRERGVYLRFAKRALDCGCACALLLLSGPVLLLSCAAVWIESRGPVFYSSIRVGLGGRPFVFRKVRTMRHTADKELLNLRPYSAVSGPVFKMHRDPRVTKVGRFLRKSSIDELPQLWNVIRGEMSLVGPRPSRLDEVIRYEDWQLARLSVRPGLTCLWQVRGRSLIDFSDWIMMDLEYIEKRGFWTDLKILIATVPAVLSGRGAF